MQIKTVTRSYSKSINTKNYGVPESWVKVEAIYTAEVETQDDPINVSVILHDAAKNDVISSVNDIIGAIKAAKNPVQQVNVDPVQQQNFTQPGGTIPAHAAPTAQPAPATYAPTIPVTGQPQAAPMNYPPQQTGGQQPSYEPRRM